MIWTLCLSDIKAPLIPHFCSPLKVGSRSLWRWGHPLKTNCRKKWWLKQKTTSAHPLYQIFDLHSIFCLLLSSNIAITQVLNCSIPGTVQVLGEDEVLPSRHCLLYLFHRNPNPWVDNSVILTPLDKRLSIRSCFWAWHRSFWTTIVSNSHMP